MKITFTTNQISEATGVLKRTVQHWITQGVLVPEHKASGSGSQNKFAWREVEICMLLGEVSKWRIHIDELKALAVQMREIITLGGDSDLQAFAQNWVQGGGIGSFATGGGGPAATPQKPAAGQYCPTPQETVKAWANVAYHFGKSRGRPSFWEIWWDETDNVSVNARFNNHDDVNWQHVYISPHSENGRGIILDLSILGETT